MSIEYKPLTGKKLVESCFCRMYDDPKVIYREYIQNSCDAIKAAVEKGVLKENKDANIDITIDNQEKSITIFDNGIGISIDKADETLLNLFDSKKDGIAYAGQYGIGRFVGAGFCHKLTIKTSYYGEAICTQFVFDVDKTIQLINDESVLDAPSVLQAITTKEVMEEKAEKHYFLVKLEGVKENRDLLDSDAIIKYLQEVVPIDFSFPFKNIVLSKCNNIEFQRLYSEIPHYKITVNNSDFIKKKYGKIIEGTGNEIENIELLKFEDDKYGLMAWGWYAVTRFSGEIPSTDSNRGIRLRKHNILIGSADYLNKFFQKEPRGNNYFYGEVHILNDNILPNNARDGLTDSDEALRLKELLREKFDNLYDLYYIASAANSAVKKINTFVELSKEKETKKTNEKFTEKFEKAKQESDKAKERLSKLPNTPKVQRQPEIAKKVIQLCQKELIKEPISIKELVTNYGNSENITPPPTPANPYEPLNEKYSESEINLFKKIFKSLTDNCPQGQKKLMEELQKKVIKDLVK